MKRLIIDSSMSLCEGYSSSPIIIDEDETDVDIDETDTETEGEDDEE